MPPRLSHSVLAFPCGWVNLPWKLEHMILNEPLSTISARLSFSWHRFVSLGMLFLRPQVLVGYSDSRLRCEMARSYLFCVHPNIPGLSWRSDNPVWPRPCYSYIRPLKFSENNFFLKFDYISSQFKVIFGYSVHNLLAWKVRFGPSPHNFSIPFSPFHFRKILPSIFSALLFPFNLAVIVAQIFNRVIS